MNFDANWQQIGPSRLGPMSIKQRFSYWVRGKWRRQRKLLREGWQCPGSKQSHLTIICGANWLKGKGIQRWPQKIMNERLPPVKLFVPITPTWWLNANPWRWNILFA